MNRPSIDNLNQDVQEYIITLETSLEEQKTRIADLEIIVQNMQRMLFGKKSEKTIPQVPAAAGEQMSLFNEAEEFADSAVPDPLEAEEIKVSAHKRKKNARKELFAKYPVLTQDYLLGTPARNCDECGREMDLIGKELVKEEYEFIPAHIEKHEFYRGVYRCKCCENGKPECFHCPFASEERCAVCRNRPRTMIKKAQVPLEYHRPIYCCLLSLINIIIFFVIRERIAINRPEGVIIFKPTPNQRCDIFDFIPILVVDFSMFSFILVRHQHKNTTPLVNGLYDSFIEHFLNYKKD